MPSTMRVSRQPGMSANPGAIRPMRKMPALTIAAACRYALTGVGAAMAAGSQKWNGKIADFEIAPASTSITAVVASGPAGASAMITARLVDPTSTDSSTSPTSIASPPRVVTSSACSAAPRLVFDAVRCEISRYDSTVVASQNTNSTATSSESTRPTIAPANAVNTAANLGNDGSFAVK